MINSEMKNRAEALLSHSLSESLIEHDNPWQIRTVPQSQVVAKEFIVLTISSYTFRALLFIHFTLDACVKAYIERCVRAEEELAQDKYYDYLCELGNTFCGTFKRELGVTYAHLGMSTPNILNADAAKHMDHFSCGLQLSQQAICGDISFYTGLHICANVEEEIVFPTVAEVPEEEKGELELF